MCTWVGVPAQVHGYFCVSSVCTIVCLKHARARAPRTHTRARVRAHTHTHARTHTHLDPEQGSRSPGRVREIVLVEADGLEDRVSSEQRRDHDKIFGVHAAAAQVDGLPLRGALVAGVSPTGLGVGSKVYLGVLAPRVGGHLIKVRHFGACASEVRYKSAVKGQGFRDGSVRACKKGCVSVSINVRVLCIMGEQCEFVERCAVSDYLVQFSRGSKRQAVGPPHEGP